MLASLILALAGLAVPPPVAPAAQEAEFVALELRVLSTQKGTAIVDRGSNDGLAIGDRVRFEPRGAGIQEGTVEALNERNAVVRLDDAGFVPSPGTRGAVRIPWARRAKPAAPAAPAPAPQEPPEEPSPTAPAAPVEHPPWKEREDPWSAREPLLARLQPVRPENRPPDLRGRLYTIVDVSHNGEDDRRDGFYRTGGTATYDNLTGRGDPLNVAVELNYRVTDVPDTDGEHGSTFRLNRLSYVRGGTRFAPERLEFGRFLQRGMPEFGVLDGVEWNVRTRGGDRYGASLGFLPEPDAEYDTGADLQIAGFYRWVKDETEELSATAGFQKTFHHLAADRDLLVAGLSYLPPSGWTFQGTAWIDFYTEGDEEKPFAEPTQVFLATGRRFPSGSAIELVYSHLAFPEIERIEFPPVEDDQLADDHVERLALEARQAIARHLALEGGIGAWADEDENGYDGEVGFEIDDIAGRGYADLSVFGTRGRFVTSLGGRLGLGLAFGSGRVGLDYELGNHRLDGFSSNNDDLPEQRLRLGGEFLTVSGWSFAGHLEGLIFDDEHALAAGFHLQKSF